MQDIRCSRSGILDIIYTIDSEYLAHLPGGGLVGGPHVPQLGPRIQREVAILVLTRMDSA